MPYKNLDELPQKVRGRLSLSAQRVYIAAYNCAWEQYRALADSPEVRAQTADEVAWRAVAQLSKS
jgi:cation transport regulator ChaB